MEEEKTLLDYVAQVFIIFGNIIGIMAILCTLLGERAREHSTLFALGSRGLSLTTIGQFFLLSIVVTFLRYLFFTERWIKSLSIKLRIIGMLGSVFLMSICFIAMFRWIPINMWQPWVGFIVCFGMSLAGSVIITYLKNEQENKKMEEALQKLKQEHDGYEMGNRD